MRILLAFGSSDLTDEGCVAILRLCRVVAIPRKSRGQPWALGKPRDAIWYILAVKLIARRAE